jgi:hypothetical protein
MHVSNDHGLFFTRWIVNNQTITSNKSNADNCQVLRQNTERLLGLRQRGVLSTLLFNGVLEAIVRRTKLQTTGTIFNKQTQLLAYADDSDIVSRSLEAVRGAYLALEAEAAITGMKFTEQKPKYMIAAGNRIILH